MALTDFNPGAAERAPSATSIVINSIKSQIYAIQEYWILSFRSVWSIFSSPRYAADTFEQMDLIGVGSLPIVLLVGFFIGVVTVLQTSSQFQRFGQTALTGDVVALALVRELGPTITGLLVAGRNSSGMASELGSMLVTEQVDAMRAMGTDPIRKLVAPRVIATVLVLPILTALSDFIGLVGGFVVSQFELRLNPVQYWTRAVDALDFSDLMQGLAKPLVFGLILATVGCYKGLTVRGGTQGVGRATTQAVVVSCVLIIVSDAFLSKLMLWIALRGWI
jgi:phospholipid/cholesterol/gamma-HCH transport system permease protein